MLPMKTILSSQFWNQEVESTHSIEATTRTLPFEPPPLGITQPNRLHRSQQLLLLQRFLALPCTPSYVVDKDDNGGWVLDRVIASLGGQNWWTTLMGRIRIQRIWRRKKSSHIKHSSQTNGFHTEKNLTSNFDDLQLESLANATPQTTGKKPRNAKWFQNLTSRLADPSLYALSGRMRVQLNPNTTLTSSGELNALPFLSSQGIDPNLKLFSHLQGRVALRHKLKKHEMALEAAFHEKCVDRNAQYWDIPKFFSFDFASLRSSPEGFRYRFGVYHSSGTPQVVNFTEPARAVPQGAFPGTKAQAAFSIEKKISLWREKAKKQKKRGYNLFAAKPQIFTSTLMGGLLSAKIPNNSNDLVNSNNTNLRSLLFAHATADMFASLGVTAQYGSFERLAFDHTLVSMRVDCGARSAFAAAVSRSDASDSNDAFKKEGMDAGEHGSPTLAATFQQQILGPVRARVDTRFALNKATFAGRPRVMEVTYGLDCSLHSLGAAKLVAWYSPSRKEGMAELRFLES